MIATEIFSVNLVKAASNSSGPEIARGSPFLKCRPVGKGFYLQLNNDMSGFLKVRKCHFIIFFKLSLSTRAESNYFPPG